MTMKALIITLLLVLMESMATARRLHIYDITESFAMQWEIERGKVAGHSPPYYKNLTRPERRRLRQMGKSWNTAGSAWAVFPEDSTINGKNATKKGAVKSENIRNGSRAYERSIWQILDPVDGYYYAIQAKNDGLTYCLEAPEAYLAKRAKFLPLKKKRPHLAPCDAQNSLQLWSFEAPLAMITPGCTLDGGTPS